MPEIYLVGGAVRDSLLALQSKDLDYTYIADNKESIEAAYSEMREYMLSMGFKIFLETPDCLTIRAKFPDASEHKGLVGDFVLARKELGYGADSRKPIVVPGTLEDDLIRRDFTINAMAISTSTGELIDLFDGKHHLRQQVLLTPTDPMITLMEDSLRVLRALRFSIKLGFKIHWKVMDAINANSDMLAKRTKETVSSERIREELNKAFRTDSYRTLKMLERFPVDLVRAWFPEGMWLMPTFKE